MESSVAYRLGGWGCRLLVELGMDPNACNDVEGRGVIGMIVVCSLVVIGIMKS